MTDNFKSNLGERHGAPLILFSGNYYEDDEAILIIDATLINESKSRKCHARFVAVEVDGLIELQRIGASTVDI